MERWNCKVSFASMSLLYVLLLLAPIGRCGVLRHKRSISANEFLGEIQSLYGNSNSNKEDGDHFSNQNQVDQISPDPAPANPDPVLANPAQTDLVQPDPVQVEPASQVANDQNSNTEDGDGHGNSGPDPSPQQQDQQQQDQQQQQEQQQQEQQQQPEPAAKPATTTPPPPTTTETPEPLPPGEIASNTETGTKDTGSDEEDSTGAPTDTLVVDGSSVAAVEATGGLLGPHSSAVIGSPDPFDPFAVGSADPNSPVGGNLVDPFEPFVHGNKNAPPPPPPPSNFFGSINFHPLGNVVHAPPPPSSNIVQAPPTSIFSSSSNFVDNLVAPPIPISQSEYAKPPPPPPSEKLSPQEKLAASKASQAETNSLAIDKRQDRLDALQDKKNNFVPPPAPKPAPRPVNSNSPFLSNPQQNAASGEPQDKQPPQPSIAEKNGLAVDTKADALDAANDAKAMAEEKMQAAKERMPPSRSNPLLFGK